MSKEAVHKILARVHDSQYKTELDTEIKKLDHSKERRVLKLCEESKDMRRVLFDLLQERRRIDTENTVTDTKEPDSGEHAQKMEQESEAVTKALPSVENPGLGKSSSVPAATTLTQEKNRNQKSIVAGRKTQPHAKKQAKVQHANVDKTMKNTAYPYSRQGSASPSLLTKDLSDTRTIHKTGKHKAHSLSHESHGIGKSDSSMASTSSHGKPASSHGTLPSSGRDSEKIAYRLQVADTTKTQRKSTVQNPKGQQTTKNPPDKSHSASSSEHHSMSALSCHSQEKACPKEMDTDTLEMYYELLAENEKLLAEEDPEFELPGASHSLLFLRRNHRRKVNTLAELMKQFPSFKDVARQKFDPLEMLNCRYLRLSDSNIEALENLCRQEGMDPGIHSHMNEERVLAFYKEKTEAENSTPGSETEGSRGTK